MLDGSAFQSLMAVTEKVFLPEWVNNKVKKTLPCIVRVSVRNTGEIITRVFRG